MLNATTASLLVTADRKRAYPVGATLIARCHLGVGVVRYFTDDGFVGVQLGSDSRVDEVPLAQCSIGGGW